MVNQGLFNRSDMLQAKASSFSRDRKSRSGSKSDGERGGSMVSTDSRTNGLDTGATLNMNIG